MVKKAGHINRISTGLVELHFDQVIVIFDKFVKEKKIETNFIHYH